MFNRQLLRFASKRFQVISTGIKVPFNPADKLLLVFTCKKCDHRSSHQISKHGYYKGSVLCECPQCKNRHLISDHMKIFQDDVQNLTLEDIMRKEGVEISYDINAIKDNEIPEELKKTVKKLQNSIGGNGSSQGLLTGKKE
ncbi:hypothetical protein QEN19_004076 [Hanseniaspora menglaensis]